MNQPAGQGPLGDDIATFLSWFLAGIATALAGGIVFVLTHDLRLAVMTGGAVLVVLRLAHAGQRP